MSARAALDRLLEGRSPARRKAILVALDDLLDVLRAERETPIS